MNNRSYGMFRLDGRKGRTVPATHVAWFVATGKWPTVFVLHHCDTPACVRFDHLFEGTAADNTADMRAKGRQNDKAKGLTGEAHHSAKLTWAQVKEIRASKELLAVLAKRFGVSEAAVSQARRGTTWKDD